MQLSDPLRYYGRRIDRDGQTDQQTDRRTYREVSSSNDNHNYPPYKLLCCEAFSPSRRILEHFKTI